MNPNRPHLLGFPAGMFLALAAGPVGSAKLLIRVWIQIAKPGWEGLYDTGSCEETLTADISTSAALR